MGVSESDQRAHLKIEQIYTYQRDMNDLSRELDSRTTDFTKVANLLGDISNLKNIENFSNIGKEAGKWEKYTRKNEEETAFYSLVLSREQQSELSEDVGNWLFE